jgi:two-component system chemotaxis sensor kinase CheA
MRRILIVDDNPLILAILTDAFAGDYQILTANSGEEAMQILKGLPTAHKEPGEKFDLVITDLNMRGINGYDIARFVKTRNMRNRFTPVILLTSAEVTKEEARKYGCAACLPKSNIQRVVAMTHILLPR